jgi:hypothetical protein
MLKAFPLTAALVVLPTLGIAQISSLENIDAGTLTEAQKT